MLPSAPGSSSMAPPSRSGAANLERAESQRAGDLREAGERARKKGSSAAARPHTTSEQLPSDSSKKAPPILGCAEQGSMLSSSSAATTPSSDSWTWETLRSASIAFSMQGVRLRKSRERGAFCTSTRTTVKKSGSRRSWTRSARLSPTEATCPTTTCHTTSRVDESRMSTIVCRLAACFRSLAARSSDPATHASALDWTRW
mmetsp:Transcript_65110/g.154231  ORF Transcript_65110/g.154231 Transcript_65110/m.154231 type:complete len:201 (+) Transcript_65110:226-828(+)